MSAAELWKWTLDLLGRARVQSLFSGARVLGRRTIHALKSFIEECC
jgi:hypothetical protein